MTAEVHEVADALKREVESFWEAASCGEIYLRGDDLKTRLKAQEAARYALEPYIFDFAKFGSARGKRVLEVGVGMGADHLQWARGQPLQLCGIDLTSKAVRFTHSRLRLNGLEPRLAVADAENLPFAKNYFDVVYSWGVIHHSPDTPRAIAEINRVLRDGGTARVMIYHERSIVGYMLWLRYALFRGQPRLSLREIYSRFLESPGTKAYTVAQAHDLFAGFTAVTTSVVLSAGDLLEGEVGQRHRGKLLEVARNIWPRAVLRRFFGRHGLFLLIEATK